MRMILLAIVAICHDLYDFVTGRHYCDYSYHPWRKKDCRICRYPQNDGKYPFDLQAYFNLPRKERAKVKK